MAEELLDGADVVAGLEQVGGEGVAEGVAGGVLGDAGAPDGLLHGALDDGRVDVVTALVAGAAVGPAALLGEDPLPAPLPGSVGVLALQSASGSSTAPQPSARSRSWMSLRAAQVLAQVGDERRGSMVARSLPPLPERTVSSPRARSRSLTRRRRHSISRSPRRRAARRPARTCVAR